jgi:hypothetical protein
MGEKFFSGYFLFMRKYFLLTLPLSFLLFLAGTSSAGATSLQDTQQFRALGNYVFSLEERKDSFASIEDKEIYREQLLLRRDVALERLGNLRDSRFIASQKSYKKAKKKAYVFLTKQSEKRKATARSTFDSRIREANASYKKSIALVNERYGKRIQKIKDEISALRKKIKKTKDPSKKIDIGNNINSLQGALKPLEKVAGKASSKAKKTLTQSTSQAKKSYQSTLGDIRADFKRSWKAAQNKAFANYKKSRDAITKRVKRERSSVHNLTRRGMSFIRQMPEPQEKKAKKKKRR